MRHSLRLTLASSLCLLLGFGLVGCSDEEGDPSTFTSTLNASSEVPPSTSTATGSATLVLEGDSSVQFRVDVQSITAVTAAHIHSGASGANGPVRVTRFDGPTTSAISGPGSWARDNRPASRGSEALCPAPDRS